LEVQDAERGDLGDHEGPILGQFGDYVIYQDKSLQFLAGSKFGDFLKVCQLIVHEKDILDVGERVRNV
jgi:hypothetical protein